MSGMSNEDAIFILLNSNEYHHAKGDLPHSAASIEAFNKAIAALKAERPQGRWIHRDARWDTCSNCGLGFKDLCLDGFNFCPNCGADMRTEDK